MHRAVLRGTALFFALALSAQTGTPPSPQPAATDSKPSLSLDDATSRLESYLTKRQVKFDTTASLSTKKRFVLSDYDSTIVDDRDLASWKRKPKPKGPRPFMPTNLGDLEEYRKTLELFRDDTEDKRRTGAISFEKYQDNMNEYRLRLKIYRAVTGLVKESK